MNKSQTTWKTTRRYSKSGKRSQCNKAWALLARNYWRKWKRLLWTCVFVRPKTHAGCPSRGSTAALVTSDNLLNLHGGDVSFACLPSHLSMVLYGPTLVTMCKMTCFTTVPLKQCLFVFCHLNATKKLCIWSPKVVLLFQACRMKQCCNEHNVHGGVNNPSIFLCKALWVTVAF